MQEINLTIIGSNSDLVKPLIEQANSNNIYLQKIDRTDWDLSTKIPNNKVLSKIINFEPSHLLFSAGINQPLDLENIESKDLIKNIELHININCISLISLINSLKNKMDKPLKGVHIISSLYGIYGRKTRLPYSISKHALEASIKCLALEYPETQFIGYRPGFFDTKLTSTNMDKKMKERISEKIPSCRLGKVEEFSKLLIHNIMHSPYYLTGSIITIDGALTAGGFFN